jgi:alkylhydroperoxidase/carboxymuconolactone decarboxylase family protein YurZ
MAENPLPAYAEVDPETLELVQKIDETTFTDGALSAKVKLLIAMALDASHGVPGGVRGLAMRAKAEGATKAEIAEALRVAFAIYGSGCIYIASTAFKDLDLGE